MRFLVYLGLAASLLFPAPDAFAESVELVEVEYYDELESTYTSIVAGGGYLYLLADHYILNGDEFQGIEVLNPANPESLEIVGQYENLVSSSSPLVYDNGYLYFGTGGAGLLDPGGMAIWNMSDPTSPQWTGLFQSSRFSNPNLRIVDDLAYLVEGRYFAIVNIQDPATPEEMQFLELTANSRGLAIVGDHAIVGNSDSMKGLAIVEIGDSLSPREISRFGSFSALDLEQVGDYLIVAGERNGLGIINVADLLNPVETAWLDLGCNVLNIDVADYLAYVACGEAGLKVVDFSSPFNPFEVGYYNTRGAARDVVVQGGYAFVTDDYAGLRVIDVTPLVALSSGFNLPPGAPVLVEPMDEATVVVELVEGDSVVELVEGDSVVELVEGDSVLTVAVAFEWQAATDPEGDPLTYEVVYSESATFSDPLRLPKLFSSTASGGLTVTFAMLGLPFILRNTKKSLILVVFLLSISQIAACGGGSGDSVQGQVVDIPGWIPPVEESPGDSVGSSGEVSVGENPDRGDNRSTVEVLPSGNVRQTGGAFEVGRTYFWKVVAEDNAGNQKESAVQTFRVSAPIAEEVILEDTSI